MSDEVVDALRLAWAKLVFHKLSGVEEIENAILIAEARAAVLQAARNTALARLADTHLHAAFKHLDKLEAEHNLEHLVEMRRAPCPVHDFAGGFCVGYCPEQAEAQREQSHKEGPTREGL